MTQALITAGFWHDRLEINSQKAIFHQWQQLVDSGCIENFRIAAGEAEGFREGFFFADSDAFKWLDAAARVWASSQDPKLAELMDAFIALIGRTQMPDGYIFTYNQIHFPGSRWQNLQVEHELYCHGHLIEAGVSHFEATGRSDLLEIARRAADRIVADFSGKSPIFTPGHEEIEIALLRLHQVTGEARYLDLARQFIEQRGRSPLFGLSIFLQNRNAGQRTQWVEKQKQAYMAAHPAFKPFQLPPHNEVKAPRNAHLRWYLSALQGKYFQQHTPIRHLVTPVGHSVRFAYLETATAMLARMVGDSTLQAAMEKAWERMVARRMFVTGGIGSLAWLEGFGNDYELDPELAYAETCAALGSMFWNWEMAQLSDEAKYSDLFEWQLYNASAVGMGSEGNTYLYNNPLASRGKKSRMAWYSCPCCPSNLSRTWASLGKYIYSVKPGALVVHQYVSSEWSEGEFKIEMDSSLPWKGEVRLKITCPAPTLLDLRLRQPSWAGRMFVKINAEPENVYYAIHKPVAETAASGFDPRQSEFRSLLRSWSPGDEIEIRFEMPLWLRQAQPRVKGHTSKAALTRGPLVYCLESVDNPAVEIFSARLDPESLQAEFDPSLLGGMVRINALTTTGEPLTFIPYFAWGNRGEAQMNVWVNI